MLVDMVSGFIQNLTVEGMTNQKILQIRYRSPRHTLKIFWAEDVFEYDGCSRFTGCRIMQVATIKGSGLFKNYHEKLEAITIPESLDPVSDATDIPEWWNRSRREAEAELMLMDSSPIGTAISHHMSRFAEDISQWLEYLSPPLNEDGE
jgi:hypothetical protein